MNLLIYAVCCVICCLFPCSLSHFLGVAWLWGLDAAVVGGVSCGCIDRVSVLDPACSAVPFIYLSLALAPGCSLCCGCFVEVGGFVCLLLGRIMFGLLSAMYGCSISVLYVHG